MYIADKVDAVLGLQYGDEGKGKITAALSALNNHSLTARYNGGPNAGHTIVREDGIRFELHQLPSSIVYNNPGYIGPGCVLDISKLIEEIKTAKAKDPSLHINLTIHPNVPLIDSRHLSLDSDYHHKFQGSTNSGIAPAYSEFYARKAATASELTYLPEGVRIDFIDHTKSLLLEGAQSFYLDINQGNYPYTTSSHCLPASASGSIGFDPRKFNNIVGVAKVYETRSGTDPHYYPNEPYLIKDHIDDFQRIQEVGKEIGVTTGRLRKVRYLNINALINALITSGTNILVFNKLDILEELNIFKLVYNGELISFDRSSDFKESLKSKILYGLQAFAHKYEKPIPELEILFSSSPKNDIDWSKYFND